MTRIAHRNWRPDLAVLLTGSQRSGTTWLAEVLASAGRFRYVFEPLGDERRMERTGLEARTYLRPADPDPGGRRAALEALFTGRVFHRRMDGQDLQVWWTPRQSLLVKAVLMTPMVPWVAEWLPEVRHLHEIRHPAAVADSRRSLGWTTDALDQLLAQPALVEDVLAPYVDLLGGLETELERHAAIWCVEERLALQCVDRARLPVFFYEDLALRPEQELPRVFDAIGIPFDPGVLDAVDAPSAMDFRNQGGAPVPKEQRVLGWRRRLSGREQVAVARLVEAFGLGGLFDEEGLPTGRVALT